MKATMFAIFTCVSLLAQEGHEIPTRFIPIPKSVSLEVQKAIAVPMGPRKKMLAMVPKSPEEWARVIEEHYKAGVKKVAALRRLFPLKSIEQQMIGGVKVFILTPMDIPEENRNRVLLHVHGGAFVFGGGETCLSEAILGAYTTKMKIISIDYRMPPDFPFPAAIEDVAAVYQEVLKEHKPANMGMFGASSGGNLIAATIFKLREANIPLPGAVGLGGPACDLQKEGGDTRSTNEFIDVFMPTSRGLIEACTQLYVGSHDVTSPLLSPIYGDFSKGFPPTILTSGTRDLLLSDTVRIYMKLREVGIDAKLQVLEGLSHNQYLSIPNSPESKLALREIALFFSEHLAR